MMVNSIETIIYTIYFMIPGFIISNTINAFMPIGRQTEGDKALTYLGYSFLNLGFWFWAFQLFHKKYQGETAFYWLLLAVLVMGSSLITGCCIALLKKYNLSRKIMDSVNVNMKHTVPTAWEYKFSELEEGRYLTVCLDDGSKIQGAYFNKSLASTDLDNMDIYLQRVYRMNDNGQWEPESSDDGIWISAKAIKWITFSTQ